MDSVKLILLSTITGVVVGAIFAFLKLPIPAPPAFSGIMAIFGIYAGVQLVEKFLR